MIQDTSFIIDLLRGDESAKRLLNIVEKEARPQKVSSVTVLELYEGVARSRTQETKRDRILEVRGCHRTITTPKSRVNAEMVWPQRPCKMIL
ncbi:PIN domain-containing protein, partial [Natronobacterium lacisalsi]